MTSPLPRIAIPEPTSFDEAYNDRSLPQYFHAVEAAGGTAVRIPLHASTVAQENLLASCSAILLPGSPADIDPTRYGQQARKESAAKDAAREAADELLLRDAFDQSKPVLGICYGLQSLNVWRGGTLLQHLSQEILDLRQQELPAAGTPKVQAVHGRPVNHDPGREVERAHSLEVVPESRLFRVMSEAFEEQPALLFVNSSHHQAVDRPGDSLMVAASSPVDGVIEALEGADPDQFVVGVQWHPERTFESSSASRNLFTMFLDSARSWKR